MATERQKKAIENVVENGGIVSKAMIDAGYSENTAKTPQKLTESKAWIEIVDKGLPDEMLLKVHQEGLKATKLSGTGGMSLKMTGGKVSEVQHSDIEVPDYATRHKYLDTAYKLKGSYAPEKSQSINLDVKVDATDPKAKALALEYEEKLRLSMLEV